MTPYEETLTEIITDINKSAALPLHEKRRAGVELHSKLEHMKHLLDITTPHQERYAKQLLRQAAQQLLNDIQ